MRAPPPRPLVSVVVLTHRRPAELAGVLSRLGAGQDPALPLIVADNAPDHPRMDELRRRFPQVRWVLNRRNLGAAGRNAGVAEVRTPFVAFCDDDTWWAPGALSRAAGLLAAHPRLAAVAARVVVGSAGRLDPTCQAMASSPLPLDGLPGPALLGFMAGACVMRTDAYRAVGGYESRLFLGAEEWLMALDFAARGWAVAYADEVVSHHHPSAEGRDTTARQLTVARNKTWIGCMRLPLPWIWRCMAQDWRVVAGGSGVSRAVAATLPGLPWAWRQRRVVPAEVVDMLACLAGRSRAG